MTKTLTCLTLVIASLFLYSAEAAKVSDHTIGDATKYCEAEVPKHCLSTTCPLFCSTFRTSKAKASCQAECTIEKRCKLRPAVGSDDPKNMILDAQNRDQLWACIAEKRDPEGMKTGRRPTPWKELETPEYKKATGRS